ncbi:TPA: glycosyltransferase [Vibrio parahaemolyticus]|uniref:Glycosyltransferase subfamily 4-like N-terminal domain-containing protein n=1 Tax=Vibrio parahaemolyticus TaxID=670 RepID=A0A7M1WIH2_VIBPH|nr:hypothetical protein VP231_00033 [Vibrio parahaemolyticus]HCM0677917.1 glycosyltransferase [Vibrio parahaemolyticus]
MKIMHIGCPYYPYLGGSTVRLSSIVEGCSKDESLELYLVTPTRSENTEKDDKPFISVLRNENINKFGPNIELMKFLNKIKPDVVILHNSRVLMNWHVFYKPLFRAKSICEIHSFRDNKKIPKYINGVLYRKCDKLVVLSNGAKNYVSKIYHVNNAHSIINGIETNYSNISSEPSKIYNASSVSISYVGSFYDWQGVEFLAKAVNKLGVDYWRGNKLHFVGDGPALNQVKKLVGNEVLDTGNVIFHGWVDKESIKEIVKETDFFIAPRPSTIATETVVPLKVLESFHYKKPMICSSVGGLTELLSKDDKLALFYEKDNLIDLISLLKSLPSKEEYRDICNNLGSYSKQLPSWDDAANKYIDVFGKIKCMEK